MCVVRSEGEVELVLPVTPLTGTLQMAKLSHVSESPINLSALRAARCCHPWRAPAPHSAKNTSSMTGQSKLLHTFLTGVLAEQDTHDSEVQ